MANLQTSVEFRGTFVQGAISTDILRINDVDGTPIDPEEIYYEIVEDATSTVVVANGVPEKVKTGIYVFDWPVATDQATGKYILHWHFVYNGEDFDRDHSVVVAPNQTDTTYYSGMVLLMRQSLELMIAAAQAIPVYNQQARPSRDYQTYFFTKGRWNQAMGTRIYLNKEIVNEGITIDFVKGSVKFDTPLTESDVINADYNFRWFEDSQLDRFMSNGLHILNSFPPFSGYMIGAMPDRFIAPVLYAAAADALRALMFDINFMEPAQFFGGQDRAEKAFAQFDVLKKNYEESLMKILEQKKNGPYVGLTRSVVVPEYTLPGGRSRWFRYLFSGSSGAG